ncbi:MAG: DUF2520 domain-containing protein [Planctomycetes bacterium]|nr:DUF2520 domain-containing protein [Planctomycetota bacterium]
MKKIDVTILGSGRVGQTLGYLLQRTGRYRVRALWSRHRRRARQAARFIGRGVRITSDPADAACLGRIIFITTNDGGIKEICARVAARRGFRPGSLVLHCSGSLTSDVLRPSKKNVRIQIGACHPLQTIARPSEAVKNFAGTYCAYEGTRSALPKIKSLVKALKGVPVKINCRQKNLYHAAGVIASNYLVTLLESGQKFLAAAGFPKNITWPALKPLIRGAITNIDRLGGPEALTGPVARGDALTVRDHLKLIKKKLPGHLPFYVEMGKLTVKIARQKGTISLCQAQALNKLFKSFSR